MGQRREGPTDGSLEANGSGPCRTAAVNKMTGFGSRRT